MTTYLLGGALLAAALLLAACAAPSLPAAATPTALAVERPTSTPTLELTVTAAPPVSTTAPPLTLTETPKPPEVMTKEPITITEKLLTDGLTDIGDGGGSKIVPPPIAAPSSAQETPTAITEGTLLDYANGYWGRKNSATSIKFEELTEDPIAALQYVLSEAYYNTLDVADIEKSFPLIPLKLSRIALSNLPDRAPSFEFNTSSTTGLTINKGANITIIGMSKDKQNVIFAFDDYTRNPDSRPRLFLGTASLVEMNKLLALNQIEMKTDEQTNITTIVKDDQSPENAIEVEPIEDTFVTKIATAAGVAFVNEISEGASHPNPVVPYPSKELFDPIRKTFDHFEQQTIGGKKTVAAVDKSGALLAVATYNEKAANPADAWEWRIPTEKLTAKQVFDELKADERYQNTVLGNDFDTAFDGYIVLPKKVKDYDYGFTPQQIGRIKQILDGLFTWAKTNNPEIIEMIKQSNTRYMICYPTMHTDSGNTTEPDILIDAINRRDIKGIRGIELTQAFFSFVLNNQSTPDQEIGVQMECLIHEFARQIASIGEGCLPGHRKQNYNDEADLGVQIILSKMVQPSLPAMDQQKMEEVRTWSITQVKTSSCLKKP